MVADAAASSALGGGDYARLPRWPMTPGPLNGGFFHEPDPEADDDLCPGHCRLLDLSPRCRQILNLAWHLRPAQDG